MPDKHKYRFFAKPTSVALLLCMLLSPFKGHSSSSDSLSSAISTETILLQKSLWSESENAAGLQSLDFNHKFGKAAFQYHFEDGAFHRYQKEASQKKYGFYTNGYAKLKDWKFYGDFSYFQQKDIELQWVDVLEPYNDNPYTIGDQGTGTYYKEFFKMQGKGAWTVNQYFNLGFDLKYKTGVGAKRKDPRPENRATNFEIKPGVIYKLEQFSIGLHFHFQTAKEQVHFETVSDSIYTYYQFKGLGVFASTTEEDERSFETFLFGGGAQFAFELGNIRNLTEVNFTAKETDIIRGKRVPIQVVLFENFHTTVNSTFLIGNQENTIKRLTVNFADKRLYGHEPVLDPKLIQENYQWETLAKYLLHWHKENSYGVNYSFTKLNNRNSMNWGAKVSGDLIKSETTYYFVPEKNEQELNYYTLKAELNKEFQTNAFDILLGAYGSYQKGFNSWYKLVEEEELLAFVNSDFVEHDFNYFDKQQIGIGGSFTLAKTIRLYKTFSQLYFNANYMHLSSKMHNSPKRNNLSIQLGINF